jgi:membrane-bound lytic murein transglycosylase D
MKRFLIILFLLSGICINAQNEQPEDTVFVEPEMLEKGYEELRNSWYVKHLTDKLNREGYKTVVQATDSDYINRLNSLPYVVSLPYNSVVRRCIDQYVEKRRSLVEYMLGLEGLYFPMIEETLDRYGLPLELKYLTIIESALNPTALSRAGAAGLWQFMLPTGKLYNLEVNSLIDERLDPEKATDAACRFLKDLYNIYNDWTLAIAAYNCGGGNVNKAIRRAGGKSDFWEIYPFLPRETRAYVPLFIAAAYIMNYYPYHQIYPAQLTITPTDTLMLNSPVHFDQIASVLKIDKEEIKALNPQYKREIIPGNYKQMPLKLPVNQVNEFISKENEILAYDTDKFFPTKPTFTEPSKPVKTVHIVKKGETLLKIANRYGVTTANIRKWNKLGSKVKIVAAGKKLTLYVNNGGF